MRCEQAGDGARDEAADEEAVLVSSERGECSRSGVEQREVVSVPFESRVTVDGESEPEAVLAVDMGEWTVKSGYFTPLSCGVRVENEEAAEVAGVIAVAVNGATASDEVRSGRLAARAANEGR